MTFPRKMFDRRCLKLLLCLIAFVFTTGFIYVGFFCPERYCALSPGRRSQQNGDLDDVDVRAYLRGDDDRRRPRDQFPPAVVKKKFSFTTESDDDVLIFLHIQKTGGTTFGRHLVKNLNLPNPCRCSSSRKRCFCVNTKDHIWLFSRYSTGWQCGLHADWTELQYCVNDYLDRVEGSPRKRRYLYITILRDPVARFLSEWRHVERGATWKNTRLQCNGRQATLEEVPFCYQGDNWQDVTIDEFMKCPSNLAYNRQTRMLANLSRIGCYNQSAMEESTRNRVLLESAQENLRDLAFFGLTEYQAFTQYLFEKTFNLAFKQDFLQFNVTHSDFVNLTEQQRHLLLQRNVLDIKLYQYAKDLFFERLKSAILLDEGALQQIKTRRGLTRESLQSMESRRLVTLVDFDPLTAGRTPERIEIERIQKRIERKAKRNRKRNHGKNKKQGRTKWHIGGDSVSSLGGDAVPDLNRTSTSQHRKQHRKKNKWSWLTSKNIYTSK
ncbi:heparan-sulfate 6-O-sulfotransferase 2-like isoform X2 [Tubulanus polymorphus]|uniref:heparan-sulfate 6-O-sulfotransferase 2-like isoform X2 n=1 Tax=Tubulanus polymorphus TaxID=672921 RepID=UPI003DA23656